MNTDWQDRTYSSPTRFAHDIDANHVLKGEWSHVLPKHVDLLIKFSLNYANASASYMRHGK